MHCAPKGPTTVTGSLSEALRSWPLFFEPVPPPVRTTRERAEERREAIARLIDAVPRVDAIDVPELIDENHEGRPRYRTDDPREFASAIAARTGREAIVNKVVAHLANAGAVEAWARDTVAQGVRNVVLVGGTSRYIPYPGPPVAEADRICRPFVEGAGGLLGNIAIPQRTGEAHRMLGKTRAGAAFFTTQIVFDAEAVVRMIREYDRLCRQASLVASPVVLSFAPLSDEQDVAFVRWLGADLPDSAERAILDGTNGEALARSVARSLAVWDEIVRSSVADSVEVPLGVNVEQVSSRLDAAGTLLRAFAELLSATAPR